MSFSGVAVRVSGLLASVVFFPTIAFSQVVKNNYVVDTATVLQNGSATNIMNGGDTLTVTATGSIKITTAAAVSATADENGLYNSGKVEGGTLASVLMVGNNNYVENMKEILGSGNGPRRGIDLSTTKSGNLDVNSVGARVLNKKGGSISAMSLNATATSHAYGVIVGIDSTVANEEGASVYASSIGVAGASVVAVRLGAILPAGATDDDTVTGDARPVLSNSGTFEAVSTAAADATGVEAVMSSVINNKGLIKSSVTSATAAGGGSAIGIRLGDVGSGASITNDVGGRIQVSGVNVASAEFVAGISSEPTQTKVEIFNNGSIDVSSSSATAPTAPATSPRVFGISSASPSSRILLGDQSTLRVRGDNAQGDVVGVGISGAETSLDMSKGAAVTAIGNRGRISGILLSDTGGGSGSSIKIAGTVKALAGAAGDVVGLETFSGSAAAATGKKLSVVLAEGGSITATNGGYGSSTGMMIRHRDAQVTIAGSLSVESTAESTGRQGVGASGLYISGAGVAAKVLETGSIKVSERLPGTVNAVYLSNVDSVDFQNAGTITLSLDGVRSDAAGVSGAALYSASSGATILNTGKIQSDIAGVTFERSGTLENRGTIQSKGRGKWVVGAEPVTGTAVTLKFVNSGSIIGAIGSTEADSVYAIRLPVAGDLTFKDGSSVLGKIFLGANGNKITLDGVTGSSRWFFDGTGTIEGGRPTVNTAPGQVAFYSQGGREVFLLGKSSVNAVVGSAVDLSRDFSLVIGNRRAESLNRSSSRVLWASGVLSSDNDRKASDGIFGSGKDKSGFVGGEGVVGNWTVGGALGYSKISASVGDDSGDSLSKSVTGGSLAITALGKFGGSTFVQGALLAGYLSQEDSHDVQDHLSALGKRTLSSSYSNYWFAPEATVGFVMKGASGWSFTPSLYASYIYSPVAARKEEDTLATTPLVPISGTTPVLLQPSVLSISYGAQDISVLVGRAELELSRSFGSMNVAAYAGYQYVNLLSDTAVSVQFGDDVKSITPVFSGRDGLYGGANLNFAFQQSASFSVGGRILARDGLSHPNVQVTAAFSIGF